MKSAFLFPCALLLLSFLAGCVTVPEKEPAPALPVLPGTPGKTASNPAVPAPSDADSSGVEISGQFNPPVNDSIPGNITIKPPDGNSPPLPPNLSATSGEKPNAHLLAVSGDAALWGKNYVAAIRNYSDAIASDPKNQSLYFRRAIAYIRYNDTFHAKPDVAAAAKISPKSYDAFLASGYLNAKIYFTAKIGSQARLDARSNAISNYSAAIEKNRSNPRAYLARAFLYQNAAEYFKSRDDYGSALWGAGEAQQYRVYALYALMLSKAGESYGPADYASARLDLGKQAKFNLSMQLVPPALPPDGPRTLPSLDIGATGKISAEESRKYLALADAYLYGNNITHALYYYKQAMLADPLFSEPHAKRGMVLWQQGDNAAAKESLENAIRLDPNGELPNYCLGVYLLSGSEGDRAASMFTNAIDANPGNPDYYLLRGLSYDALKNSVARDRDIGTYYNMLVDEGFPA